MRRSLGITEDEPVDVEITRMRRRHLKGVMAIERQVYPRPWSPNLFLSEMTELRNRCYLVAKVGRNSRIPILGLPRPPNCLYVASNAESRCFLPLTFVSG